MPVQYPVCHHTMYNVTGMLIDTFTMATAIVTVHMIDTETRETLAILLLLIDETMIHLEEVIALPDTMVSITSRSMVSVCV